MTVQLEAENFFLQEWMTGGEIVFCYQLIFLMNCFALKRMYYILHFKTQTLTRLNDTGHIPEGLKYLFPVTF